MKPTSPLSAVRGENRFPYPPVRERTLTPWSPWKMLKTGSVGLTPSRLYVSDRHRRGGTDSPGVAHRDPPNPSPPYPYRLPPATPLPHSLSYGSPSAHWEVVSGPPKTTSPVSLHDASVKNISRLCGLIEQGVGSCAPLSAARIVFQGRAARPTLMSPLSRAWFPPMCSVTFSRSFHHPKRPKGSILWPGDAESESLDDFQVGNGIFGYDLPGEQERDPRRVTGDDFRAHATD